MSTKSFKTYVCDRCGKTETVEDGKPDDLHIQYVELCVTDRYGSRRQSGSTYHRAEWCRSCCVETHMLKPPPPEIDTVTAEAPVPAPLPPTLEELVRGIVREEMGQ